MPSSSKWLTEEMSQEAKSYGLSLKIESPLRRLMLDVNRVLAVGMDDPTSSDSYADEQKGLPEDSTPYDLDIPHSNYSDLGFFRNEPETTRMEGLLPSDGSPHSSSIGPVDGLAAVGTTDPGESIEEGAEYSIEAISSAPGFTDFEPPAKLTSELEGMASVRFEDGHRSAAMLIRPPHSLDVVPEEHTVAWEVGGTRLDVGFGLVEGGQPTAHSSVDEVVGRGAEEAQNSEVGRIDTTSPQFIQTLRRQGGREGWPAGGNSTIDTKEKAVRTADVARSFKIPASPADAVGDVVGVEAGKPMGTAMVQNTTLEKVAAQPTALIGERDVIDTLQSLSGHVGGNTGELFKADHDSSAAERSRAGNREDQPGQDLRSEVLNSEKGSSYSSWSDLAAPPLTSTDAPGFQSQRKDDTRSSDPGSTSSKPVSSRQHEISGNTGDIAQEYARDSQGRMIFRSPVSKFELAELISGAAQVGPETAARIAEQIVPLLMGANQSNATSQFWAGDGPVPRARAFHETQPAKLQTAFQININLNDLGRRELDQSCLEETLIGLLRESARRHGIDV